jgi:hypothetical protein
MNFYAGFEIMITERDYVLKKIQVVYIYQVSLFPAVFDVRNAAKYLRMSLLPCEPRFAVMFNGGKLLYPLAKWVNHRRDPQRIL